METILPLRVGFVGCRHVHFQALHRAIARVCDALIVGLVEKDPAARERGLAVLETRPYTDIGQMVSDAKPGLLCVAVPNGCKAQVILESIERGIHVMATKPPLLGRDELDEVASALETASIEFYCPQPLREKRLFRTAREVVVSGMLGRIHHIRLELPHCFDPRTRQTYFTDKKAYGGIVMDFGWNVLDYLWWLTGSRLHEACGFRTTAKFKELPDFSDHAIMSLSLDDGTLAAATVNWTKPLGIARPTRQVAIHGEKGRFDGIETADELIDTRMTLTTEEGVHDVPSRDYPEYRGVGEFVDAVQSGSSRSETTNRSVLETMRDLLVLDESIRPV